MLYDFYEVLPRVIPCGKEVSVSIRSRFRSRELISGGALSLQWVPVSGSFPDGTVPGWEGFQDLPFTVSGENGEEIRFKIRTDEEGELSFRLVQGEQKKIQCEFGIYAVKEDLYQLRPFRGDMHVHSNSSECGFREDDPRFVTAIGRLRGLDFMTLNDHMQMEPSLQAAAFWRRYSADLQIFPGEETHLLTKKMPTLFRENSFLGGCHIVNFGGRSGVVQAMNDGFEAYSREVAAQAETFDPALPETVRFMMAGADWLCNKIHELGGLAFFCHPYWTPAGRCDLPAAVREFIFEEGRFDAVEIVGLGTLDSRSLYHESNLVAIARWQQYSLEKGRMIPAVGNTDSHNARNLLGRQYTIVFGKKCSLAEMQNGIRSGRTVAVFDPENAPKQFYGDLRYVRFAGFLLREFYPEHDALCQAEGLAMLEMLRNEPSTLPSGRIDRLLNRWWGKII